MNRNDIILRKARLRVVVSSMDWFKTLDSQIKTYSKQWDDQIGTNLLLFRDIACGFEMYQGVLLLK